MGNTESRPNPGNEREINFSKVLQFRNGLDATDKKWGSIMISHSYVCATLLTLFKDPYSIHNYDGANTKRDYIDYIIPSDFPDNVKIMKGVDVYNRPFITFTDGHSVQTIFKRYSDTTGMFVVGRGDLITDCGCGIIIDSSGGACDSFYDLENFLVKSMPEIMVDSVNLLVKEKVEVEETGAEEAEEEAEAEKEAEKETGAEEVEKAKE